MTASPTRDPAGRPSEGRRPRVLVVDDSATVRGLVSQLLGPGYECRLAESGAEALACARGFAPDVIVSDVLMPGMDGYELCRRVRGDPELASTPLVLLTSVTDTDARAHGLEAGADDYLFKPVRRRELLARLSSLLRVRRTMADLEERTHALEDSNRTLVATQNSQVRAEKLATVGTFVAGLAHEMNNSLTCLKSGAAAASALLSDLREAVGRALAVAPEAGREALRASCEEPLAEVHAVLAEMSQGTARLLRIAQDLRAFGEGESSSTEAVDLAAEAELAWKLATLEAAAAPGYRVEPTGDVVVRSARHLVSQVLLGVLRNAAEAAGQAGEVRVALRGTQSGVLVSVQDDGPGIPPEHLPRIFDPFFTTKPRDRARGLGLSVAYGVVGSLGGRIDAVSEPGSGATFRIWLPRRHPGVDGRELTPRPP